ncbi:MAG: DUF6285 domain-containing protein [Hyphomicrobiaceae bacterium]
MRRLSGEALIDLAIQTLKADVREHLASDARYALAMSISALEIARREWLSDPESRQWELLDNIYDDGDGSLAKLGRDIRDGTVNDVTHPDLRQLLERLLVAELEVRNPQALKERQLAASDLA